MDDDNIFKKANQTIKSFKENHFIVFLIAVGTGIILFIQGVNAGFEFIGNLFPSNANEVLSIKPLFKKAQNKDSINILVTRFEDYYVPNSNCIGRAINYRIKQIAYKKELPINVIYVDSLQSPITPDEAKLVAQRNNSDLIIYGRFRSLNNSCGDGQICFKTTANNLLESDADSNNISPNKEEETYKSIKPDQIESGEFSLDTISFDSWIQSLYVLKKRVNIYDKYIALYKLNAPSGDNGIKLYKYNERAMLNRSIGNYYDAILDYDSAYVLSQKLIKEFADKKAANLKTIDDFARLSIVIEKLQNMSYGMLYNKLVCYTEIKQPKKALKLIDAKIREEELKVLMRKDAKIDTSKKVKIEFNNGKFIAADKNKKVPSLKGFKLDGTLDTKDLPDLYLFKSYILLKSFKDTEEGEKAFLKAKGARDINVYYGNAIMMNIYNDNVDGLKYFYNDAIKKSYSLIPSVKYVRDYHVIESMVDDKDRVKYFYTYILLILFFWVDSVFFIKSSNIKFFSFLK